MPAKNKVLSRLSSLWIARTKTGTALSTTLSAAAAKGASSLTVVSITNGADGDPVRIGSGEEMELNKISGAPSGSTINLAWPLTRAHAVGEDVKEMTVYDHGAPDSGGVDVVVNGEVTDVNLATQRLPLTNIKGFNSVAAEWRWPYVDLNTFATSVGALLSKITGAGTVASPKQFITDGNEFGEDQDIAVIAGGVLVDGTFIYVELWGCSMNYTQVGTLNFRRGGEGPRIGARAKGTGGVSYTAAPGYAIDASLKAQKNQVWRSLSEVGLRTPAGSGVNSTLAVAPAAGATVIDVASGTGAAAGDRIKIGTGSDAEYPVINSVNVNQLTLRTKLLRAHVIGEPVVEQTNTVFAGVSEEGVDLTLGGDVRAVRVGTRSIEIGDIPGNAQITFTARLVDIVLANLAYALNIAQSDISGNRLPLDTGLGVTDIDALYFKGVLQNGDTFELDVWGVGAVLEEMRLKLANEGVSSLSLSGRPATLQLLQYQ